MINGTPHTPTPVHVRQTSIQKPVRLPRLSVKRLSSVKTEMMISPRPATSGRVTTLSDFVTWAEGVGLRLLGRLGLFFGAI